jgi:hypothetical protein
LKYSRSCEAPAERQRSSETPKTDIRGRDEEYLERITPEGNRGGDKTPAGKVLNKYQGSRKRLADRRRIFLRTDLKRKENNQELNG